MITSDGASTAFTSRYRMHQINDVCNRVECTDNGNIVDGKTFWMGAEIITNAIFSLELVLRVFVSSSLSEFFKDKMNIFDLLSVIPFYGEIISAYTLGVGYQSIDFSILASSPDPIMLVYMRGFKVRHSVYFIFDLFLFDDHDIRYSIGFCRFFVYLNFHVIFTQPMCLVRLRKRLGDRLLVL